MSSVGVKVDKFGVPICNSFQARLFNDQLCYEVDLNKYSNNENIERELKAGFIFMIDHNEDRQVTFDEPNKHFDDGSFASLFESDDEESFIYFNTIGNNFKRIPM